MISIKRKHEQHSSSSSSSNSTNRYMYGKVSYTPVQILNSNLEECELLTHDEVVSVLLKWFSLGHLKKNMAIASNYPWVYKLQSEISNGNVNDYKILIIPPVGIFGKMTMNAFKTIILMDKFAKIFELTNACIKNSDYINNLKYLTIQNNEERIQIEYNKICKAVENEMRKYKLNNLASSNSTITTTSTINNNNNTHESSNNKTPVKIQSKIITLPIGSHELISAIPSPFHYVSIDEFVQELIDKNIHFHRNFGNIPMKGNTKFTSMLQGRDCIIRNAICNQKVRSIRCQIMARPELKPNELIMPIIYASMLKINPTHLINLYSPEISDPRCFNYLNRDLRILLKRDPVINGASISAHDTIAFAHTDYIYIGLADLKHKNADFDGDTESAFLIDNPISIDEIDLNMLPQNNIRIFQQIRIAFAECHILYMHQRKFTNDAFRHAKLYNYIRDVQIYKWLSVPFNQEILKQINDKFPEANIYKYIEPTAVILERVLDIIAQIFGSREAYDFYNFININVIRLANGSTDSPIYDPELPFDFYMEKKLLCPALVKICTSGAKGSIETLLTLANKLYANDQTTDIIEKITKPIIPKLFKELANVNQSAAHKSRDIQQLGHEFFKSNIGYDGLTFDQKKLSYNGRVITSDLRLPNVLLLNSDIAGAVTLLNLNKK